MDPSESRTVSGMHRRPAGSERPIAHQWENKRKEVERLVSSNTDNASRAETRRGGGVGNRRRGREKDVNLHSGEHKGMQHRLNVISNVRPASRISYLTPTTLQSHWDLSHSGSCRKAHRTLLPVYNATKLPFSDNQTS